MSLWEKLGAFVFRDVRKSSISICRETSEFDAALGSPRNYGLSSLKPLSGGFPKNIPVGRGSSSEFGRNIPYPKRDISSTTHDSCPELGWKIKQDPERCPISTALSPPGMSRLPRVPVTSPSPWQRSDVTGGGGGWLGSGTGFAGSFGKAIKGKRGVKITDRKSNDVHALRGCHGN